MNTRLIFSRCKSRLFIVLGSTFLLGSCASSSTTDTSTGSKSAPAKASVVETELDPTYRQLDPNFNYYNVVEVDETRDHYTVVFSDAERAYCTLGMAANGELSGGCGFPASALHADEVPEDKQSAIPALKAEVLSRAPNARNINVRYEGTYRRVVLEEFRPCDFQEEGPRHGHAFSRVFLRYDDALTEISQVDFSIGSDCGAMFCYWCERKPRWVPLRTEEAVIGIPKQYPTEFKLIEELQAAIGRVLRDQEGVWNPPTDLEESEPPTATNSNQ